MMKKLIQLYFDDVFCGWADPRYEGFFRIQGYDIYIFIPGAEW